MFINGQPLTVSIMMGSVSFADTAYAKNSNTGKWYNFDDSHVAECSDKSIVVSDDVVCTYICRSVSQEDRI